MDTFVASLKGKVYGWRFLTCSQHPTSLQVLRTLPPPFPPSRFEEVAGPRKYYSLCGQQQGIEVTEIGFHKA